MREETRVRIPSAPRGNAALTARNLVFPPNLKLACQSGEDLILNQSEAVWSGIPVQEVRINGQPQERRLIFEALISFPTWADQVLVRRWWAVMSLFLSFPAGRSSVLHLITVSDPSIIDVAFVSWNKKKKGWIIVN